MGDVADSVYFDAHVAGAIHTDPTCPILVRQGLAVRLRGEPIVLDVPADRLPADWPKCGLCERMEESARLRDRVLALRAEEPDLSQREMARRLGCSPMAVSNFLRYGTNSPRRGRVSDPDTEQEWWTIAGSALLAALRRSHEGEDPELVYAELYANSDVERPSEGP